MAITSHLQRDRHGLARDHLAARVSRLGGRYLLTCIAGLSLAGSAWSQAWRVEPTAAASVVATDNVTLAASAAAQSDQILTFAPQLLLRGSGASYRLDGSLGATGVHYMRHTLSDRVLPSAHLGLNARVVDRLLFLDSRVDADTTGVDPFRSVGDGVTTYNKQTVYRSRLSPYLDRELSSQTRLTLRSDNTWARIGTAETTNGVATTTVTPPNASTYVQTDLLRLETQPRPLGYQLEATRLDTLTRQQGTESTVLNDTLRAVLLYAPDPDFYAGVRFGRDKVDYSTVHIADTFTGFGLRWAPSARTNLDAQVENRFFGRAWLANLVHRSPFMTLSANFSRQLTSYAQSLATLPTAGSTSTMLDQIYRVSIPDASKRADVIRSLITKYNLPDTTSGPLDIFSDRPQIQESGGLSVAFLGVHHTVTFNIFQQKTIDLPGSEQGVTLPSRDVLQRGATLGLIRRLDPNTALDTGLSYTRSDDLGVVGRETTSRGVRLGLSHKLSPRSDATAGLRHNLVTSTVGVAEAKESAAYVGMTHRF